MEIASTQPPIRVLYIMGVGHSGSTVLDTVLGNHPQVESFGELINLASSGWINGEYCACGEKGNLCPFWSEVRDVWLQRSGVGNVAEYLKIQSLFETPRFGLRLLRERYFPSVQFQTYATQTRELLETIRSVSGGAIVVDSSKSPVRAYALSLIPGIDLYVVHLVRDGRGVVWSLKKGRKKDLEAGIQRDKTPRPIWRTSALWIVTNLQSEWVRLQLPSHKSVQVRYEDFLAQPHEELARIGQLLGIDFNKIARAVGEGCAFSVGHTIAGNRMRMAGKVRLRLDEEWRRQLTDGEQRQLWALAGWLMRKYHYQRS